MRKAISKTEAIKLLSDGKLHHLRLWKMSTGDILDYDKAVLISRHVRGGTCKVRLTVSNSIRAFREICLFEIDGMTIYL